MLRVLLALAILSPAEQEALFWRRATPDRWAAFQRNSSVEGYQVSPPLLDQWTVHLQPG